MTGSEGTNAGGKFPHFHGVAAGSSVELESGLLPTTLKKATAEKQSIKGSDSTLPPVIVTHGGHKVEGRKKSL